jgi:thiol-disulfide isomerase/thioredoxin
MPSTAATAICRQLLFGLWMCGCLATASAQSLPAAESLLNRPAPQFARQGLNGTHLDLANYRGKIVLLNFWATWCAPCQIEMPVFVQWQRQYGPQGLQVIGISMDDDRALARKLAAQLKLNYPVAMGDEKLGELYGGVLGLPLTYLIDKNGIVRARFQGEISAKIIETKLQELLTHP